MALASLFPHHVFGIRSDLKDVLHFVDETTVVYPAGHNLVVWSTDQKSQKIISGSPDTDGISAIALSFNKKQVALAERIFMFEKVHRGSSGETKVAPVGVPGDAKASEAKAPAPSEMKFPQISVYDTSTLKKKKLLAGSDIGSREYVSISFTSDGKSIAAQGGAPEWNLVLWSMEKQKVVASVKASYQGTAAIQVQCCPANPSLITVIGVGFARTFRATDTVLRPVSTGVGKRENQIFLCHTWLTDRRDSDSENDVSDKDGSEKGKDGTCIYSLNSGELLFVDGGEIVATISAAETGGGISETLVQYSKGFICGESKGVVAIYEKQEGGELIFKKTQCIKMDNTGAKVTNLALSPNEDLLLCSLENNQLLVLPFQNLDLVKPDEVPRDIITQAFHSDAITGMDMCIRRPIIATCSVDKSVRIWNYVDKCCEIVNYFPEEALSIALHPNGLHVLVGFADKLRFMNLLLDDIRMTKEFNIKGCGECCFSTGGQFFAAVHSNAVHVFETYTCVNIGNLRAHSGKVRSVTWSYDDNFILTAGIDGAVYEWELKGLKRVRENVIKGCVYSCVLSVKDSKTFFGVGSDRKLKEMDDSIVIKSYTSAVVLTQIALLFGSRLLFAGTEVGSVRAYRYPLSGDYYEVRACSAAISHLSMSGDGALLACSGDDGVVMVFDVRDKERSVTQGSMKKDKDALGWAQEVLVSKADVEDMRQSCQDLESKVIELATYCEYQLKCKEHEIVDRIKEMTEQFTAQLDESRLKMETLMQQKAEEDLELEQKQMQIEENHAQALQDVEEQYQKKMMVEVARYTTLEQEKSLQDARWQEEFAILQHSHEKALQDLIEAYEDKLDGEKQAYIQLKKDKEQANSDFAEIRRQHEEDQDQEIEETKASYEIQLSQEKDTLLRIKGENGIMKKKMIEFAKDLEVQREEIRILFQQKKELYEIIAIFERDMIGLRKDIQERDETIGEKEKRIYDLKRKNQELEKFKFVLDYKIKDLKQQVEPRELELQDSRDTICKMEIELGRSHTSIAKKDLTIAELRLKLSGMSNEEVILRRTIADISANLKHFQHDFYELAQHIQDPKVLKTSIMEMLEKYVQNKFTVTEVDEDVQRENARQRLFLEKTVEGLQKKLFKELELSQKDHVRLIQENAALVKELNETRQDLKATRLVLQQGGTSSGLPNEDEAYPDSPRQASEPDDDLVAMDDGLVKKLETRVQELELDISVKEERIKYLEGLMEKHETVHLRPKSRSELPPMDG